MITIELSHLMKGSIKMIFSTKGIVPPGAYITCNTVGVILALFAPITFGFLDLFCILIWAFVIILGYAGAKLKMFAKSYISLYEDRIEGVVISGSKNIVTINYSDIQTLTISEDQNRITVRDK